MAELMLIPTLKEVAHLLAPWQSTFSNSKIVSTSVTALHLLALLFGGGVAVATDRLTLRAAYGSVEDRRASLTQLHAAHRPVLFSLAVLFTTGMLLVTADIETFMKSPVYWVKMGLVLLLVLNGVVLTRTETQLRHGGGTIEQSAIWKRLVWSSWASLLLWTSIVLSGTILVNAS